MCERLSMYVSVYMCLCESGVASRCVLCASLRPRRHAPWQCASPQDECNQVAKAAGEGRSPGPLRSPPPLGPPPSETQPRPLTERERYLANKYINLILGRTDKVSKRGLRLKLNKINCWSVWTTGSY